jgi:ribose transport system substrate-binding protein
MKRLNVLVSLITRDNDYQLEQEAVAQTTAQSLKIDAQVIYAEKDAVNQSLQLLNAIQSSTSRPDAIIVEPAGTGMPLVAEAAARAGIGWVVLNGSIDYIGKIRALGSPAAYCVNCDNEQVGRIQGEQFNALLGRGGCVLYVEGPSTSDPCRKRTSGMLETKRPDIVVKTLKGDWTEAAAFNAVNSWLRLSTSKTMHVGAIGCQNDAMALGARKAVHDIASNEERQNLIKLPFLGCDGVAGVGQAEVRRGALAATVVVPALTGPALQLLVETTRTGVQPMERTLIPAASFPPVEKLAAKFRASAGS